MHIISDILKESCVETVSECRNAQLAGAQRLELCASIDKDGLTPDTATVIEVLKEVTIPVKVMIRCREGDFFYNKEEMLVMLRSIADLKKLKIAGFVFGALKNSGGILEPDLEKTRIISEAAFPVPVTFHKAIDLCSDILQETQKLCHSGLINSILSSGGAAAAEEGLPMLNKMHEICRKAGVELIGAGKITQQNLPYFTVNSSISSFHGRKIV